MTDTIEVKKELFESMGNLGNWFLFFSTVVITFCMLNRFPDESYFDTSWLEDGFCVVNPDSFWLNSHTLAFYSDAAMTFVLAAYYYTTCCSNSKTQTTTLPPFQEAMLVGSMASVFFHGTGHLFYGLMNPTGTDFRFHRENLVQSIAAQIVAFAGFGGIYKGAMAMATPSRLLLTALLATSGITVLDVPTQMLFVYAQGAIYVASCLHMLTLDRFHKRTAAYMLFPWFQLPVLALGIMESTICESIVAPVGGHVLFDTSISVGYLATQFMATRLESSSNFLVSKSVAGVPDPAKKSN